MEYKGKRRLLNGWLRRRMDVVDMEIGFVINSNCHPCANLMIDFYIITIIRNLIG